MTDQLPPVVFETAQYLAGEQRDILSRWLQLISRLPSYLQRPETSLRELRNHMPDVFQQLLRIVTHPHESRDQRVEPFRVAEAHAVARYRQHVAARIIVKEYQILRHEIWSTLRTWHETRHFTPAELFILEERINFSLDEFIAITLDTFVELEMTNGEAGTDHGSIDPGR